MWIRKRFDLSDPKILREVVRRIPAHWLLLFFIEIIFFFHRLMASVVTIELGDGGLDLHNLILVGCSDLIISGLQSKMELLLWLLTGRRSPLNL